MRLITVKADCRRLRHPARPDELESELVIEIPGRWLRLAAFCGEAPGSNMMDRHWALWRTRSGTLTGVNVRFGWWPRPCVTLLAHTRPERDVWGLATAQESTG